MIEHAGHRYLTVDEAAARVDRTRRTIQTWMAHDGLPVYRTLVSTKGLIREDQLLDVFRRKLAAPVKYRRHTV